MTERCFRSLFIWYIFRFTAVLMASLLFFIVIKLQSLNKVIASLTFQLHAGHEFAITHCYISTKSEANRNTVTE